MCTQSMVEYQIIDNALPETLFRKLYYKVVYDNNGYGISYNALLTTYYDIGVDHFCMTNRPKPTEPLWELAEDCLLAIQDKMDHKIQKGISRLQYNCFLKHTQQERQPHVDSESEHMVGILYLNDSDGDTVLYNETAEMNEILHSSKNMEGMSFTEALKVTPKANRLLVFNGKHYHASGIPVETSRRMVINYNFY
jgi:hypothetical protein